jgi:probable rRNA maturation factor
MKRTAVFNEMKNAVLGKDYDLSVVFVRSAKMRELNMRYRGIDKPTDILSFPLSKNEGEVYICLSETKKEAPKFKRPYENFLYFLFIHGLVHLKGFDHSSTMERIEVRYRKMFKI